ncbi:MAG: phage holin family protein [Lachnospiraceae bacterium]|nr:phage holin family protein [Lachnospiraceae bacterium]
MDKFITGVTSVVASIVASLFGVIDMPIQGLLWFMLFDILSGLIKAVYIKKLDSTIMWKGLLKKSGILLVICVANRMDIVLNMESMMIRNTACMFYIAMEGLSLVENLGQIVELPKFIVNILNKLHDDSDTGGKENV